MVFIEIIIGIAIFSVLWAIWSLHTLKKRTESTKAKEELAKSRVVFYKPADNDGVQ